MTPDNRVSRHEGSIAKEVPVISPEAVKKRALSFFPGWESAPQGTSITFVNGVHKRIHRDASSIMLEARVNGGLAGFALIFTNPFYAGDSQGRELKADYVVAGGFSDRTSITVREFGDGTTHTEFSVKRGEQEVDGRLDSLNDAQQWKIASELSLLENK